MLVIIIIIIANNYEVLLLYVVLLVELKGSYKFFNYPTILSNKIQIFNFHL